MADLNAPGWVLVAGEWRWTGAGPAAVSAVLTLAQAEDVAARTLAAIEQSCDGDVTDVSLLLHERVASDLAGLRECEDPFQRPLRCEQRHARRYSDGLLRTAALYGVEVPDA